MNTFMKPKSSVCFFVGTGAAILAAASLWADPPAGPHRHGTDILHFFVHTTMNNEGVTHSAAGRVDAGRNQQGHADNQRLRVTLRGLDANAAYQLLALVNEDTNLTTVAEFSTDNRGRAALDYRSLGNGRSHGHGKSLLPEFLDPVSNIRELDVFNSNTQAVLSADLTLPDRLQYLIKRDLSTNDAGALLRIKATTRQTQFRLIADGLDPQADYWLVLNGGIVQTNRTDDRGRLRVTSLLLHPTAILDVRSLGLWDTASNVVLYTELP
jgi:hypothetical protein